MVQLVYVVIGAVLGLVAESFVEHADAPTQHAIEAAVVGAALGLVLEQWVERRRRFKWKSLKVSVPLVAELEFGIVEAKNDRVEKTFVLTEAQRQIGWRIYVQLITRVSTQPVPAGTGTLRGTLSSLHTLMQVVREDLREFPPSAPPESSSRCTVETLTCWILGAVRAVLAKWHPRLRDHEDRPGSAFAGAEECLADLERTRSVLTQYAVLLSEILEVQPPEAFRSPKRA